MFTFPYIKVKSDIPALLCIADVVVLIVLITMKNEQTKSFQTSFEGNKGFGL